ncbi:hypothetical protein ACVW00_003854 [Marmoricola sp. URHA0025 HA25]
MISTPERETFERGRLPVAPRDKRPALAALALLLILLGALGSALLVFRSGDRESVLAARDDISFGQVMTRGDFSTVRAAADGAALVPARLVDSYVGTRATSTIPAGALLSPKMFNAKTLVPDAGEGVGIVLDPTRRPSQVPETGQVVRVYFVAGSGSSGESTPDNPVIVNAARVIAVGHGAGAGTTSITVLVRSDLAGDVTNYASSGNLAVTVLPDDTKPSIDWKVQ